LWGGHSWRQPPFEAASAFYILSFMIRIPLLAILASLALAQNPQVDKIFAKWDTAKSPGCALSVMKDGHIVYKRGYGMADLDHDIPITPATVFHVASISKQFTAASILLLAQDGKLSLDDDVRKYIPELPDFGSRITIRHLLHHTSGLRDQWELLGLAGWRYSLDLITDDDVLELVSRQKDLNFKPGEKYVYCNTGFTLLAQIVKRVSGQSLREFTIARIFNPLDMKSTHFRDDHAEIVKHIAYGYVEGKNDSYSLSVTNFDTVGATSLLTTVEDLAHWDENFYHPTVGGPKLVEQQLLRGKLNTGVDIDYASGLIHGKYRGLPTVDHNGADAGYRADLLRFPGQHFSVACLCNQGEINPSQLTQKVAEIYLAKDFKEPSPVPAEIRTVSVSKEKLTQYAGIYWQKEEQVVHRVLNTNGKLTMDGAAWVPVAENRFQLPNSAVVLTFDAAGMSIKAPNADKPQLFARVAEFHATSKQLAAYAGSYVSDEIDPVYRIAVENGALMLTRSKVKPQKLRPIVEDYFQGINGVMHFQKDASGRVTGFILTGGRIKNFRFKKKMA
jgi:CubicO group peptidase (beta-lactamase class C family)